MVEHRSPKPRVVGSSPPTPAKPFLIKCTEHFPAGEGFAPAAIAPGIKDPRRMTAIFIRQRGSGGHDCCMKRPFLIAIACLAILLALPLRAETLMDEGFRAAQEGMQSSAGAALSQIGQRTAAGQGALADLVRARQSVEVRLKEAEAAIVLVGADRIGLAGNLAELTAELATLDTKLGTDFPRYAELTQPEPLSIAAVQDLLAPDEALLLTFVGETYSFIWAISPTSAAWQRVNAGAPLMTEVVTKLRETLDPDAPTRSAVPLDDAVPAKPRGLSFDRALSAQIYNLFLSPLEPVFGQARHVYVVADGPLTSIPFSILVTGPYDGADDDPAALRATPWMIRRFALTTLPSIESLSIVKSLPPPAKNRPALAGFGDPLFTGGVTVASLSRGAALFAGGLADVDRLKGLPPLPATRRELISIAKTLGADPTVLRMGDQATEAAVKATPLNAAVVAFATHGLLSGDLEGLDEPALVLTPPDRASKQDDGLLTASEIIDLKLDADWVLLSACNTAGGDRPGAEGLSGLARAFLFAGARSIVVSHWPVRDDAAARLTTGALSAYAAGGLRRAEALQQSMLAVMDDNRDPTLAHPSAWAPFVIVGQGG